MKLKQLKEICIVGIIYLIAVYFYSLSFGLPPFHRGFVIGYPAIYYEFPVRGSAGIEYQYGFTHIKYLVINVGIVIAIYLFYTFLKKTAIGRRVH